MSDTVTIEAELPVEVEQELRRLADQSREPVAALIREAIDDYIAWHKAFAVAVEEGLEAADAGRVVDHAEVVARFERRRAGE